MTLQKQILPSAIRSWILRHRGAIFAVSFWFLVIFLINQYMSANQYSFADLTNELSVFLKEVWYGPLLYILLYAIRPLILFPASLLTILGGSVFGLWPGVLYVLFAGTISATLPYGLGRWFSSETQATDEQQTILQRFNRLLQQNPFQAVLMMRLLYLPYDAVSILAGNLRIPFSRFLIATALGNLAGTVSFLGIGASIEGNLASGDISLNPQVLVFSVIVLLLSIAISRLLNRYQQQQTLKQTGEIYAGKL